MPPPRFARGRAISNADVQRIESSRSDSSPQDVREERATTTRGEFSTQGCVTGSALQPPFTQRAATAGQLGPPAQVPVSVAQMTAPSDSNSSRNDELSAATT